MKTLIYLLLSLIFLLTGCGKDEVEKKEEAILQAQIFLNENNCSKAIQVLEQVGVDNLNADFVQTYASAYACMASFDEPDFFQQDLPDVGAGSLLNGLGLFSSTTAMSSPTAVSFTSLQRAIDILLYAGNIASTAEPTVTARAAKFSSEDAGDINIQLFFMVLAQLGNYYKYYGNSDANGIKGQGSGSNRCFLDYSENITFDSGPADMAAFLGGGETGVCDQVSDPGHPDLGATGAFNNTRICQGIVLMNHLLQLIPVVIENFSGGNVDNINSILSEIEDQKTLLDSLKAGASDLAASFNQTNCETLAAANDDAVQAYFAAFFEVLFP